LKLRDEMEKAEARKLQPYFIRAFFAEAFQSIGGEMRPRETGRFEIRHVPAAIRERDRVIGETRTPVLKKYERICFEKQAIRQYGKAMVDLIHPAHPLMHATIDLVLQAHRRKIKQGAVMVDPTDEGMIPRILFMVDHTVKEAPSVDRARTKEVASRRLQFVAIDETGHALNAGWAPHLDLLPIDPDDLKLVKDIVNAPWLNNNLETLALTHASQKLVPDHYREVKQRREQQADKILAAVNDRLIREINHWSDRYIKLKDDVSAGKQPRVQPEMARRRVDELTARLEQRKSELTASRNVVSSTPVVIGGALVIPQGLLKFRKGESDFSVDADSRAHVERVAMETVMETEKKFGHEVTDVGAEKCGWDVTARPRPGVDGAVKPDRHIEVKGRSKGQTTITVSRNEIIYALNQVDKFILAVVIVDGDVFEGPFYIRNPFQNRA